VAKPAKTMELDWTPVLLEKDDGVIGETPTLEQMASTPIKATQLSVKSAKGRVEKLINSQWKTILKAAENGYEFATIAKAIGVSEKVWAQFLAKHRAHRQQLIQAKLKPRDLCVQVILNAAKDGQWLPAAWWLERTCWQEFARPEVRLQLMDRENNQTEVVQTFGGKSLQQLNKELREQHGKNPQFRTAIEQSRPAVEEIRSELGNGPVADDSSEG